MMSDSKLLNTHCAINGCKSTIFNKHSGVTLFSLPSTPEQRMKWVHILKIRTSSSDWSKVKICSKHFELKNFDSPRKLLPNALPTLFPNSNLKNIVINAQTKLDRMLSKWSQAQLVNDIKNTMGSIRIANNYTDCINEDVQCIPNTSVDAQLWLLIKKQDHLIARLNNATSQQKKQIESLQKSLEEARASKKELESVVESQKYIVKCLHEKQATLEEQVEILGAVESR